MKGKYIVNTAIVLILALIVFKLTINKQKINAKTAIHRDNNLAVPVKVSAAKEQPFDVSIQKIGTISPFKEAKVLSLTAGTITQLRFNLGDQVSEGQVLATIDNRLAQLDLEKAETNVNKLRNDVDTYTELLQGKAATQEKVNELQQNYADAVNQVSRLRKNLADAAIRSPTAGIISVKSVEQGIFVNAGAEIATVVNLSRAKVQVYLTENEVYQVTLGQSVKITADVYPGKVFPAEISFISPQADQTHNYLVEMLISNNSHTVLRSGTFVYADLSKKTDQKILVIPREALTESTRNAKVYVVNNNVVYQKAIQTGAESGENIQVINGLKAGDLVVTSGQINLKNGSKITISK